MAGSTTFPTAIDSYSDFVDNVDDVVADNINDPQSAIMAIEAKVGVDSSAEPTSLDYLVKNAASKDPGHTHTKVQTFTMPIEWAEDGANPPDAAAALTVSNKTVRVRKFQGDTSNQDVTFAFTAPWDIVGTTIIARVVFFITEATGPSDEGVRFTVDLFPLGDGDALDGTYGTAIGTEKTGMTDAQYDRESTGWSAAISTVNAGETIILRLIRTQDHVNDDYAQDVGVWGLEIKFTEDSFGT